VPRREGGDEVLPRPDRHPGERVVESLSTPPISLRRVSGDGSLAGG
jgi:hypothetical protein